MEDYKRNKGTLRKTAEKYGVPKSTLERKVKHSNSGKHGGQKVLTTAEESALEQCLLKGAEWGFPLRSQDCAQTVKSYLDRRGRVEKVFKISTPGRDWTRRFLKENKDVTKRFCENIKRSRAAVSPTIVKEYFDNLQRSLGGVPPGNVLNWDETNFTDDPKSHKVLVRRGCRHPEQVMDLSKTATSVMFTVSGDGQVLPVYVVYKSVYLYHG